MNKNEYKAKLNVLKGLLKEESPDFASMVLSYHYGNISQKELQRRMLQKMQWLLNQTVILIKEDSNLRGHFDKYMKK